MSERNIEQGVATPCAHTGIDFIRQIINEDNKLGKFQKRVHTRFPPEPNGYLHIGHAKSICLNYGIAKEYGGKFNLRFDDTNPCKEEQEYVDSIIEDIRWLGADFEDRLFFASDYFDRLYEWAEQLIKAGKAYVCDLSADEMRVYRGTLTQPGKLSPNRDRSVDENLDLFRRMKAGEFIDGSRTLRAKLDMSSPNINLRDPVMYRILHAEHHRTGNKWCIYPSYDWTHGQSDSIEKITHSICTLEFEDHRPLYDWFLEMLGVYHPQQIEFARLNLTRTVMSKRKLLQLVELGIVSGWDDPRMPTIAGLRRRGYTPEAIRDFCNRIGVAKADSMVDIALLEHCLREDLNKRAQRVMAVLRPVKVVIENYPADNDNPTVSVGETAKRDALAINKEEWLDAVNNPEDESMGTRKIPFSREIYIEQSDFMENPPKKFFRLSPGAEVRLKHAYYITCTGVVKNEKGEITELRCTYDPESRGGGTPDNRIVRGTLHFVSAKHAVPAKVRLYDHLFTKDDLSDLPEGKDVMDFINPNSLEILTGCLVEPCLADAHPGDFFQFMRHGYFCVDKDSANGKLVFNRSVSLADTWEKIKTQNSKVKI